MKRHTLLALVLVILIFPTLSTAYIEFTTSINQAIPDSLVYATSAYYDGKIFLIGGENLYSTPVSSVYIYENGSWYLGPSLPFALASAGATVCNNTLYVVGGANSTSIFGGILKFTGNGWKVISDSMPIPVYGAIVFSYDYKIYVIGGMNYSGNSLVPPVNYIQVYNLKTNAWEIIGNAPLRLAYSAYYFNGSALFVVGGFTQSATLTSSVFVYYPENNTWISLPSLPGVEAGGVLGYYEGYLYLVGGLYYISGTYQLGEILYYYNGTWRNTNIQEQISTQFSTSVQIGNRLIILGGFGPGNIPSNAMQTVSIYLPPPKPQIASVASGNETITLKWYDINASGYYITYWSNFSQKVTINVGNVTSYTIKHLKDGITYYIQIIPYNSLGNGIPSDIVSATPSSVPNPPIIKVKIGNLNATLTWYDTFNGGYPIEGYYLYINGKGLNVGNVTSYVLTNLTAGELYTIELIAYNKIGNSSIATVSFIAASKANLTVTVYKKINGFLVSWNSTSKAKYILTVSKENVVLLNVSTTNTSYFVKVPFGVYNVSLEAINTAGITEYTFTLIYYIQPASPTVNWSITLNTILLNWSKVFGAEYYLIYNNGKLVTNTTNTTFTFNLTIGQNEIEVYAANAYYKSAPYIIHDIRNYIVVVNSTVISISVPQIKVVNGENTDAPLQTSNIDLKSAIIVIAVFVIALLMILVILRERSDNYW
ncbi:fibronectin type III domain-containing protein [Sulfurisphaera ohwakuensis]|uniref:Fibronectin n=1 Tax=Sulfurisphaera ohwakuensis TaxID=69656 RepID=A0A650CGH8_SULOH|nr:fibronectin type III domain-containing protein [Sulfurisphaera ohwakuensis]MBB5252687.1 N-acetylneuraminic acid mutarotase [Sulfurisphaera ohwakuensis]QGR16890.1 fibronectin [Sulfurisphaera ohwakuensis]